MEDWQCPNCGMRLAAGNRIHHERHGCRMLMSEQNAPLERREFIRRAAIAYFVSLEDQPDATHPTTLGEVWDEARHLWDARPEDC